MQLALCAVLSSSAHSAYSPPGQTITCPPPVTQSCCMRTRPVSAPVLRVLDAVQTAHRIAAGRGRCCTHVEGRARDVLPSSGPKHLHVPGRVSLPCTIRVASVAAAAARTAACSARTRRCRAAGAASAARLGRWPAGRRRRGGRQRQQTARSKPGSVCARAAHALRRRERGADEHRPLLHRRQRVSDAARHCCLFRWCAKPPVPPLAFDARRTASLGTAFDSSLCALVRAACADWSTHHSAEQARNLQRCSPLSSSNAVSTCTTGKASCSSPWAPSSWASLPSSTLPATRLRTTTPTATSPTPAPQPRAKTRARLSARWRGRSQRCGRRAVAEAMRAMRRRGRRCLATRSSWPRRSSLRCSS